MSYDCGMNSVFIVISWSILMRLVGIAMHLMNRLLAYVIVMMLILEMITANGANDTYESRERAIQEGRGNESMK
jgi:hypothetical protein